MAADVIERFLQDAETAARQGDRPLALTLLELALDTAPGDPAILVRAHAIRHLLPPDDATARARRAADPAPSPSATPAPRPVERGPAIILPAISREAVLVTPTPAPSSVNAEEEELEDFFAARPPAPVAAATSAPRPRAIGRRIALALLWVVLAGSVAGTGLALTQPAAIEGMTRFARSFVDPYAKAERAYLAGDYAAARTAAQSAINAGEREAAAALLLGRAALADGDRTEAVKALSHAVAADTGDFRIALDAGRLLAEAGDPGRAADALGRAYERGAPLELWQEIAEAQHRAGRRDKARNIYDALARAVPGTIVPPAVREADSGATAAPVQGTAATP